jgi:ribosome maturation factor RimP
VTKVVQPAVIGAGYELEELGIKAVGRRYQVKIVIDGDGGLGLDAIAEVSRVISRALDDAEDSGREFFPGEYQLEVSSPGVDRPLTKPQHWRRNVGRLIKVKVAEKTLTGRLTAANDQGITLEVSGIAHRLGYAQLGPGRVQIEFSRLEEISEAEMTEFSDDAQDGDGAEGDDLEEER